MEFTTIARSWGDPEGFLRDLGRSDFIDVVEQYIGLGSDNRYTVGGRATFYFTPNPPSPGFASTPFTDADMLAGI